MTTFAMDFVAFVMRAGVIKDDLDPFVWYRNRNMGPMGSPGMMALTRIFHTFVFRLVFLAVFRVILDFFVSSSVFRVVLTQFPLSPIGS